MLTKEVSTKMKNIFAWVITVLILAVLIVPYIVFYFYLRKQGKSLQIHPEFKVIDSKEEPRQKDIKKAVINAKDILKKAKEKK